ncbi:TPA: hypothetical protein QDB35_000168 [Burkholderia vietnamiensis]|nr:hypothetical protein [Burkholderia vietnamiensis]
MLYTVAIAVIVALAILIAAFWKAPLAMFRGESLSQRFARDLAAVRAEHDARDAAKNASR